MAVYIPMAACFLIGVFMLAKKDNALAKALSRKKEAAPEKISTFLGLGCLGLGASCIPSILGSVFHNNWLHLLSIVLVVLVIGAATVYEWKGKIK